MGKMNLNDKVWVAPKISMEPSLDYNDIKALYYEGMPYKSYNTRVFAYLGVPKGASETDKVPAVVLAHGGCGMAYPQWVEKWVENGFAAIAMDLEGNVSNSPGSYYSTKQPTDEVKRLIGGPSNTPISSQVTPVEEQWMHHAVSDIFLAFSLLSADTRVDNKKIGISGISWGGIITSIAIGVSDCFDFAIPIYGCAYLTESKSLIGELCKIENKYDGLEWITETSKWLKTAKTPTLWVNSNFDCAFSVDTTTLTAQCKPESYISIIPDLIHSHSDGWDVAESYAFAKSIVEKGEWTVKIITQPTKNNMKVEYETSKSVELINAVLYFRTKDLEYSIGGDGMYSLIDKWENQQLQIFDNCVEFSLPDNTKMFYINVSDNQGNIISSELVSW